MEEIKKLLEKYTMTHDNGGNYIDMNGENTELLQDLDLHINYRILFFDYSFIMRHLDFPNNENPTGELLIRVIKDYCKSKYNLEDKDITNAEIIRNKFFKANVRTDALLRNLDRS